ncbi:metallophosphoesterase [Parapedobacter sp. ISTM3]|uniref:metallophosphoesterase family protein n=1 Tax=Parapedobacter sp. ISTM3 TaxID=2800130 RepID=UPI00190766FE|nr:metallophosphoesterase [Parapedobacter sp. ISTM3]MBK1438885.1 metallophosphoesterase [Parapedobacter sp. ISTM3]
MKRMSNLFIWGVILLVAPCSARCQFRVLPYLLPADADANYRLTWFTETAAPGCLAVWEDGGADTLVYTSSPLYAHELGYSALEESERENYPDMFAGTNWKHAVYLRGLVGETTYRYRVVQGQDTAHNTIRTAPETGKRTPIRFIAMADSETDPDGRKIYRSWPAGPQHEQSTGRPDTVKHYLLTETEGFIENLKQVRKSQPDFVLLAGDLVQGGGYQRAWDEFFFHTAGKFDDILGQVPLLPAIGNWENYGARNGGYAPEAIRLARAKYKAYFSLPPNGSASYQDCYYRVDYGPVTIITLDSSNGLPDSTDDDTNVNINVSTYPSDDLPDINPGSAQWEWAVSQLKDAHEAGQVIFVQFHHVPYSSGGHILPLTAEGSSGQAGVPMRKYTPIFKQYGVVAVICGHNEALEHSVVDGVHFWDVGIAGDGLGAPNDDVDPRRRNEYSQWSAHKHAKEYWDGNRLVEGGKHYGHLLVDVRPHEEGYTITMTPQYIFPVRSEEGRVQTVETRRYNHVVHAKFPND